MLFYDYSMQIFFLQPIAERNCEGCSRGITIAKQNVRGPDCKNGKFLFALFTLWFDRKLAPSVLQVCFLSFVFFFFFFFFFCQISIVNLSLGLDLSLILIIEIVDLFCNLNTFLVVIIGMFQRNLNKEDNPIN